MKIQRKASRAEVPVMAMGDIAFNLLIFFVILANPQDPLIWQPAKGKEITEAGHSKVTVAIDIENNLYLNGGEIGVSSLAERIKTLLGNELPGNRTVLLKVHDETTAQRFQPVLEAIGEAGGDLVHILEQQ